MGLTALFLQEEEENAPGQIQDNIHGVHHTLPEEYGTTRAKRVFLSRGWMAGGYKAPDPSPNRFVRRPPALVQMPASFPQPKPGDLQGNEAHYEALVSDQPQQSPPTGGSTPSSPPGCGRPWGRGAP
ncbi:uncharacterized protein [Palaemon carinicauda]|uniref:uncharacterized protein n=1 Tax=Palaemon carinicauda TaxID=392227 RepID=UPI0035B59A54